MKTLASVFLFIVIALIQACSDGDTSVDSLPVSEGPVPNDFVGTYVGTLSATARSGFLEESATNPITIIVSPDNTLRFQGDDPEEVFVTTIGSNGNFNGSIPVDVDDCSGTVDVSGNVDGTVASGDLGGTGDCSGLSVGVSGDFSAIRQ